MYKEESAWDGRPRSEGAWNGKWVDEAHHRSLAQEKVIKGKYHSKELRKQDKKIHAK